MSDLLNFGTRYILGEDDLIVKWMLCCTANLKTVGSKLAQANISRNCFNLLQYVATYRIRSYALYNTPMLFHTIVLIIQLTAVHLSQYPTDLCLFYILCML